MERMPVVSSNISAIGYDPEKRTLEVEFKNENLYEYFGVPQSEYEMLMNAPSVGGYFNKNVRDNYSFNQIV